MVNNRVLLVGPPNAGKGTVSDVIIKCYEQLLLQRWIEENNMPPIISSLVIRHARYILDLGGSALTDHFETDGLESHFAELPSYAKPLKQQLSHLTGQVGELDKAIKSGKFKLRTRSTGDMIREQKTAGKLPEDEKQRMDAGGLCTDQYLNPLVLETLKKLSYKRILLDGYPRSISQLDFLWGGLRTHDGHAGYTGAPIDTVFYPVVEKEVARQRSLGRRICTDRSCDYYGETYNILSENPLFNPKKMGISTKDEFGEYETGLCDLCGNELSRREDDLPEKFDRRWAEYREKLIPMLEKLHSEYNITAIELNSNISRERMATQILMSLGQVPARAYLRGC